MTRIHDIVAWNTGRGYTSMGQRIAAMLTPDGGLLFVDIDRYIEGFVPADKLGDDFHLTRADVMRVYDYQSRDWDCMVPFRYPDEMQRLRSAARRCID